MICSACQTPNEADARFCEGCGSPMERRCAGCGTPASATARFCKSCGGSLVSPVQPAPAAPTRKTVTVLFADLAGSTTFEEKVDAETAREVLGQYHTLLARTAQRHRAGVTKYIGDGFMAVWGVPEISADDADHAVDAAVELQERFVDLAAEVANTRGEALALRVAVNTGEVVVGSDDADLVGDALNVAARLESQCPHGQVVVGEETWRSTRGRYRYEPLSPVQVKGRVAPVAVYQWAGRRSEPADSIPFVGRTHEFRRLTAVLDDAVAHRGARLVTVMGDPGVGKTRLASEFAASQQDAVVLQIRCAADGTVALAPVVEALRTRDIEADIPAAAPERDRILRDLNGMTGGVAGSVEETFWALRRYLEVLAARGLLILVLDDVQWADALLLDFVEHLSEWVRDAPVLMIALGRPELRESRPELVTVGGWVGDAIRLGGLEPGATTELAARVLGTDKLPTELLSRLPSSTGGNPLFVRELVAMLVHDGVLVAEADGWRLTIDADAIAVPPTIQALLASRLERINTADRRVLETASVIGTDFSPAAVSALSGASPAEVKASLDRMRRLELAQPSGAYSGDEPVWRFHHILIRDVAYRRLLKSDRADLHERFADWVRDGDKPGCSNPTNCWPGIWSWPTATAANSARVTPSPRSWRCSPRGAICRRRGVRWTATPWCPRGPRQRAELRSPPPIRHCGRSCCWSVARPTCQPVTLRRALRWWRNSTALPMPRSRHGRRATDASTSSTPIPHVCPRSTNGYRRPSTNSLVGAIRPVRRRPTGCEPARAGDWVASGRPRPIFSRR